MTTTTNTLPLLRPAPREVLKIMHQLRERADEGTRINLDELLDEAYKLAGVEAPLPPKVELRWESREGQYVTWKLPSFGSITVEIDRHGFGDMVAKDTQWCAPIVMCGRPNWLTFRIIPKLNKGVRLLYAYGGKPIDVTEGEIPLFKAPVKWNGGIPCTTNTDDYDFSLVLVDQEGVFIQLDVGVVTRAGHFWLTFEEVWSAQVARTTSAKAKSLSVTTVEAGDAIALAVPFYPENNYPKADFLTTKGMVHEVISYCIEQGLSKPLSKCSLAKWETVSKELPVELANEGYVKAKVLFFNMVWGGGFALCEDGASCHMHFSKILGPDGRSLAKNGQFPVVAPMTEVAIKWVPNDKGRSATVIRAL